MLVSVIACWLFSFTSTRIDLEQICPKSEPVARDLFLEQLKDISGLSVVAANLESTRIVSSKPNVPLFTFSQDAIQKAVVLLSSLNRGLPTHMSRGISSFYGNIAVV